MDNILSFAPPHYPKMENGMGCSGVSYHNRAQRDSLTDCFSNIQANLTD
ncbi:MAG: hypothetical protein WCK77_18215 [Verrucomicrobiota bacterium]